MILFKRFFSILILSFPFFFVTVGAPKVKNVILMIGDGMGLSQAYAAATVNRLDLTLFKAPYVGLSLTYSANRYITDSAAGGSAIATGHKSNNGMIGMDADSMNVISVMQEAKAHHLSTGVAVTVAVTHATPASFYAHNISRKNQEAIAVDLINSQIDFFVGGGRLYFEKRADQANLLDSLRLRGYDVTYTLDELARSTKQKKGALLALIDLEPAVDRKPVLVSMTQMALDHLSTNPNGFFLMVEGSQIDYQAHNNETDKLVAEVLEFDQAVAVALEFVKKHPETLLVVTADHETGGMVVTDGDLAKGVVTAQFFSDYHTGVPVPVYSFGAGAELFAGVYQNTAIYEKIMTLLDF